MKRFVLELEIPTQTLDDVAWVLEEVAGELRSLGTKYRPMAGMNQGIDGKTGKVGSWRVEKVS